MLPELAVSGYPPEDLLFHSGMRLQVARSLERLKQEVRGITLIAGYPEYEGTKIFNSAIVIRDGAVLANHRKACLPNYRVFDEKRYFTPGHRTHHHRAQRHQSRRAGVRGRLGRGAGAPGARRPARRCCWSSTPRPTRWTSRRSASRRWCARGSAKPAFRWCSST